MGKRKFRIMRDETWGRAPWDDYDSKSRGVSGFGWYLWAVVGERGNRLRAGYLANQVIEWGDRDPAVLSAFVAGDMPPWAFADYLEDNGVELPGRVYELLRSGTTEG